MPSNKGTPLLWEVWEVNQTWARSATKPPQPNDPKEPSRPYLIIADPLFRCVASCCPIQEQNTNSAPSLTEVALPSGYQKFITKNCRIICHEIYTLELKYFTKCLGNLEQPEQSKVGDALYEFLKV